MSKPIKKDGQLLAVLRPAHPEKVLAATKKAKTKDELKAAMKAGGDSTLVGLAGEHGALLDPKTLRVVGRVKPGDSFIGWDKLVSLSQMEGETAYDAPVNDPDMEADG